MMYDLAEQIKILLDIRQVVELYGYRPNKHGWLCCPFHAEKTPSCKIYDESNTFFCFGCGEGGTVIDFVVHLFGLSAKDACQRLNDDFHLGLTEEIQDPEREKQIQEILAKRRLEHEEKLRSEREWESIKAQYWRLKDALEALGKPVLLENGEVYWNPLLPEAMRRLDYAEYLVDDWIERHTKGNHELGVEVCRA